MKTCIYRIMKTISPIFLFSTLCYYIMEGNAAPLGRRPDLAYQIIIFSIWSFQVVAVFALKSSIIL